MLLLLDLPAVVEGGVVGGLVLVVCGNSVGVVTGGTFVVAGVVMGVGASVVVTTEEDQLSSTCTTGRAHSYDECSVNAN